MELFRKSRKNTDTAVWRNASGKIECPGGSCPMECDDTCPIYANILRYLFAKSMGQVINEAKESPLRTRLMASTLPDDMHSEPEKALDCGKQFYPDIKSYAQNKGIDGDAFTELYKQTAVVIQRLGQLSTRRFFKNTDSTAITRILNG